MTRLNSMLCRSTTPETFATLFFAILDTDRKTLRFSNAGHNYPVLINAQGEIRYLEKGGLLLGVMDNVRHEEDEVKLLPGDVVVFYTDGVTEADDRDGIMFGEDRLERVVREERGSSAGDVLEKILQKVEQFSGSASYQDDITMVVLKVL
jgi:sigma-B regulation protein RsbU (phosphoserine phosphatase)